jgi:prepilin-type processing-associated H-X9-DG protein
VAAAETIGMTRANIIVCACILAVIGGLIVRAIHQTRQHAYGAECKWRMEEIGIGLANYHAATHSFPDGTISNPELAPDDRLSWLVKVVPYMEAQTRFDHIEQSQSWRSQHNCELLKGAYRRFLCPANPTVEDANQLGLTHYIGIAGVGRDAASLEKGNPNAGVFGYDRRTSIEDITDGFSTTIMMAESASDNGPLAAGGSATVRGLDGQNLPHLGANGQFSARHNSGSMFSLRSATNVLFVDGSVRYFTNKLDPKVFEAMATIAGGEKVDMIGGEY